MSITIIISAQVTNFDDSKSKFDGIDNSEAKASVFLFASSETTWSAEKNESYRLVAVRERLPGKAITSLPTAPITGI